MRPYDIIDPALILHDLKLLLVPMRRHPLRDESWTLSSPDPATSEDTVPFELFVECHSFSMVRCLSRGARLRKRTEMGG